MTTPAGSQQPPRACSGRSDGPRSGMDRQNRTVFFANALGNGQRRGRKCEAANACTGHQDHHKKDLDTEISKSTSSSPAAHEARSSKLVALLNHRLYPRPFTKQTARRPSSIRGAISRPSRLSEARQSPPLTSSQPPGRLRVPRRRAATSPPIAATSPPIAPPPGSVRRRRDPE